MIKLFITDSEYSGKFNAVDDLNNVIGFSTSDDCCAHGGWFVSTEEHTKDFDEKLDDIKVMEFPDYHFDTTYIKSIDEIDSQGEAAVIFKMVAEGMPDLYLHLFNCHNGYYGKGWETFFGVPMEGTL